MKTQIKIQLPKGVPSNTAGTTTHPLGRDLRPTSANAAGRPGEWEPRPRASRRHACPPPPPPPPPPATPVSSRRPPSEVLVVV